MQSILNFFHRLAQAGERREQERQEAYLAKATDINDLEYRIRELERQSRDFPWVAFTRK